MTEQANNGNSELLDLEAEAARLEAEQQAKANPPPDQQEQQQTADQHQQAYVMAGTICALLAKGATLRWPYLKYPDETIKQGAEVLAPVLVKYNMQSEFLEKWAEEISAAVFFGTLIATSYATVKAHEAEEKRKAAEKEVKTDE